MFTCLLVFGSLYIPLYVVTSILLALANLELSGMFRVAIILLASAISVSQFRKKNDRLPNKIENILMALAAFLLVVGIDLISDITHGQPIDLKFAIWIYSLIVLWIAFGPFAKSIETRRQKNIQSSR